MSPARPEDHDDAPPPGSRYQRLDHDAVRGAAADLQQRIRTRFPDRSLWEVCAELVALIDEVGVRDGISRRRVRLARVTSRVGIVAVVLVLGGAVGLAAVDVWTNPGQFGPVDLLPLLETAINNLVFGGVAVFFLLAVPERLERQRVLRTLHRLRSLAHVIDMHQLTKVPERRESPAGERNLDGADMTSYLDQCTEMLALVGKTAALFAEETTDGDTLDAVEGLESLTSDMARKVWQKIAVIQSRNGQ